MKNILYIIFFLVLVSCVDRAEILKADFSYQPQEIMVGTQVNFANGSVGIDENTIYSWDFGDGSKSNKKNPVHTYNQIGQGTYTVSLSIKNSDDNTDKIEKKLVVSLPNDIDGRKTLQERLSEQKMLVCAHRTYHKLEPENSLSGIRAAIDENLEMIEIDVRETRDKGLVLMHDATIERTTNGEGKVSEYTLQELKKLRLYHKGKLTDEKIPTLQEVLMLARGKIYIDLDISSKASFDEVYAVVNQFGMLKQVLFYSSDPDVIKNMVGTNKNVIAMPIIRSEQDFDSYVASNLDLHIVHYTSSTFNEKMVKNAKEHNWAIFMNAYINSDISPLDDNYSKVNKIVILQGNVIQTDYPVIIKKFLN